MLYFLLFFCLGLEITIYRKQQKLALKYLICHKIQIRAPKLSPLSFFGCLQALGYIASKSRCLEHWSPVFIPDSRD